MNRKEFIYQTAVGLAAMGVGVSCAKQKGSQIPKTGPQTTNAELGNIRALLLHLGSNMWCDYPTELMGAPNPESAETLDVKPEFELVWTDEKWRIITDRAAARPPDHQAEAMVCSRVECVLPCPKPKPRRRLSAQSHSSCDNGKRDRTGELRKRIRRPRQRTQSCVFGFNRKPPIFHV